MIKRLIPGILGLFSLSLPLAAQEIDPFPQTTVALGRPTVFSASESTSLPALTLLDERHFLATSELGRMGMMPNDLFPLALLQVEGGGGQKANLSRVYGARSSAGMDNFLRLDPDYSSGEVGAYYGRSGGKYGREEYGSYVVGTVGNDKFQITAGASYQESNGRVPRWDALNRYR